MNFKSTYAALPERFRVALLQPAANEARILRINDALAVRLGLDTDWLHSEEGVQLLTGAGAPEGAEPVAMAYAGHQFGYFNPRLGDGRALLVSEVLAPDGALFDIHLKGSGPTPFSRGGDGRAPLGPVLREYVVSEAMAAMGVKTTRALAALETGERVMRDRTLPGAVLARVAASHIRVGTFEFFASQEDIEGLRLLWEFAAARHDPGVDDAGAWLDAVVERQARLIARWQLLGFVHGVMNTDNMLVSGETIDYGPCAFVDGFDPDAVYSSIDHQARYRLSNQPRIAQWNLAMLAQSILPLISSDEATAIERAKGSLDRFAAQFEAAYHDGLAEKLGLEAWREDDEPLAADLLQTMADERLDFTSTFARLTHRAGNLVEAPETVPPLSPSLDPWLERWETRRSKGSCAIETMARANPVMIPRNHLVEAAIETAYQGKYDAFHALAEACVRPFDYPADPELVRPPRPDERVQQTFCGT